MGTQVFVFTPRASGASFLAFAARITGIALLVIVSSPILLGQRHGMRAAARPVRIGADPQVRAGFSGSRNGGFGSDPLAHRHFAVQRFPFRHHRHFNVFVANACFNDSFFDPFLCRRFFFRNSLFFAQPLLLPYPIYADTSYGEPEQSVLAEQHEQSDLGIRIDRLTGEVERLREEQESTKNQQQTPNLGRQSEPSPPTRSSSISRWSP